MSFQQGVVRCLASGVINHNGLLQQKLRTLKKSQIFIDFPVICPPNLNFFERRKSFVSFLILIWVPTLLPLGPCRPGAVAPLPPVCVPLHSQVSIYRRYNSAGYPQQPMRHNHFSCTFSPRVLHRMFLVVSNLNQKWLTDYYYSFRHLWDLG
jgi:hypothetical protein